MISSKKFFTNLSSAALANTAMLEILTGLQAIFATGFAFFFDTLYPFMSPMAVSMILTGFTQITAVGSGNLYFRHYTNAFQSAFALSYVIIFSFSIDKDALAFGGYLGLMLMTTWCFVYTARELQKKMEAQNG